MNGIWLQVSAYLSHLYIISAQVGAILITQVLSSAQSSE